MPLLTGIEDCVNISIVQNVNFIALMKLTDHADEHVSTIQICHHFADTIVAHSVNDIGQVDVICGEIAVWPWREVDIMSTVPLLVLEPYWQLL